MKSCRVGTFSNLFAGPFVPPSTPASQASGPASQLGLRLQAWLTVPQAWLDGPEGGMDEQMNRWMDEWKISLFYRTLSPIGAAALPPPMKTKEKVEQGKGTADHLMPLGY